MGRYELSDFGWNVILPLLHSKSRGKSRVDDRRVLNGMFWVLRAGVPWADPPGALRSADHDLQSLQSMAKGRGVEPPHGCDYIGRAIASSGSSTRSSTTCASPRAMTKPPRVSSPL